MSDRAHAEQTYLELMARGDQRGLEMLEPIYRRRLLSYIRRWIPDAHVAEDVLQEVWLAAWQGATAFRGESRVGAWLLGIAHHKIMSALRGRRDVQIPLPEVGMPAAEADPADTLLNKEAAVVLRAQIARLPAVHRATLDLVFTQGLSLGEVAAVMECPVGTVKSRLHHARQRLLHIRTTER